MGKNSNKRILRNSSNLENSLSLSSNVLSPLKSAIISSSPNTNTSNIMLTPVIQVEDILSAKAEISNLVSIINDMQLQINDLRTKLNLLDPVPETIFHLKKELGDLTFLKLFKLKTKPTDAEMEHVKELENAMDYLSSEVVKRLASKQNAIVYNIPDNEPIKSVQHSLLRAANLLSTPCQCIRLNKKELNRTCPILFRFDSCIIAEQFRKSGDTLTSTTKFKNVKIVSDKTPSQRQVAKNTLDTKTIIPQIMNSISAEVSKDTEAQSDTCIVLGEQATREGEGKPKKGSNTGMSLKVLENTPRKATDPAHEVDIDASVTDNLQISADNTAPRAKQGNLLVKAEKKSPKTRVSPQASTYLPCDKPNKQHVSLKKSYARITAGPIKETEHEGGSALRRTKGGRQTVDDRLYEVKTNSKYSSIHTKSHSSRHARGAELIKQQGQTHDFRNSRGCNMPMGSYNLRTGPRINNQNTWATRRDTTRYHMDGNAYSDPHSSYVNPHQHNGYRLNHGPSMYMHEMSPQMYNCERLGTHYPQNNLETGYFGPVNNNLNSETDYLMSRNDSRYPRNEARNQYMQQDYFRLQQTIAPLAAQFVQGIVDTLTMSHLRIPRNIT
ncbi:unnamed protein product [Trichobilharzia szidati]|nr:unnamed protein product [Trichobilharzia szidati]